MNLLHSLYVGQITSDSDSDNISDSVSTPLEVSHHDVTSSSLGQSSSATRKTHHSSKEAQTCKLHCRQQVLTMLKCFRVVFPLSTTGVVVVYFTPALTVDSPDSTKSQHPPRGCAYSLLSPAFSFPWQTQATAH